MAVSTTNVVNENYSPGEREEKILELLKEGREQNEPWGRVNPKYVTDQTEMRRQYVNRALGSLEDAGWVKKLTTGLYELVDDPREGD
jgi:DNA-binding IclR family transcriptional regulator